MSRLPLSWLHRLVPAAEELDLLEQVERERAAEELEARVQLHRLEPPPAPHLTHAQAVAVACHLLGGTVVREG